MKKIPVLLIIILAALLRFWQLTTLPALNADEAAIGYNAFSLLGTGRDEHGNPWPIHFQSFNDYKPGLYFYLVLPFVKFLGLTGLAVRLPGALMGLATVLLVWLLVRELFPKKTWLAETSALFLAISPWHIHFSRGGWEVNAATFFITFAVLAFVKGVKNSRWFYLSVVLFVVSLYTYHAARVVVPPLVLGLLFIFRKSLRLKKQIVTSGILGFIILLPLVVEILGPAGISRAGGVGLFADPGPLARTNEQRGEHQDFQSPQAIILHNKVVNYGLVFWENYAEHFWGEFLFLSGDEIQRNKVPEMGQMYLLDFVFLVVGLAAIVRKTTGWGPILLWLVFAPIGAALTFQSPHALRAHNMVVPLTVISAYGFLHLLEWLKNNIKPRALLATFYLLLFAFLGWDFSRYLHQYYVHLAKTYDFSSQYGVKELVSYVEQNQEKYSSIVVTDHYDQPYILFLFYLKYPSDKFQSNHQLSPRDRFGFSTVSDFDKFHFMKVNPWDKIRTSFPGALIAGIDGEIPDGANIIKTIYFPSGRIAFQIVAN